MRNPAVGVNRERQMIVIRLVGIAVRDVTLRKTVG
jgi:hypothetical protein